MTLNLARAERQVSAAAESGSDTGEDAVRRRLDAFVRCGSDSNARSLHHASGALTRLLCLHALHHP